MVRPATSYSLDLNNTVATGRQIMYGQQTCLSLNCIHCMTICWNFYPSLVNEIVPSSIQLVFFSYFTRNLLSEGLIKHCVKTIHKRIRDSRKLLHHPGESQANNPPMKAQFVLLTLQVLLLVGRFSYLWPRQASCFHRIPVFLLC